jgi:putative FmdB family regulatory protein
VPTYQYACTECGHGFETVQSFTDDSLTVCPQCGARLRKVFNSVGIVFKGTGFYRTDSREKPSSESDAKASETKGDSKGSDSTAAKDGTGDKAGTKTTKSEPASTTSGSGSSGSSGSSAGSSSGSSSSGSSTAGSAA